MKFSILLSAIMSTLILSCGKAYKEVLTYEDMCRYIKISDDTFEVHIEGGYIDPETLRRLFLSRAAEVTLQSGGKYFVVIRDNRVRDPDGKISQREAMLDDQMLERLKAPESVYLNPLQLKQQLELSNSGTIKVWNEVPPDVQFYDAALISKKMTPLAKEETRNSTEARQWPQFAIVFVRLLTQK